jgi:hypothetical protein
VLRSESNGAALHRRYISRDCLGDNISAAFVTGAVVLLMRLSALALAGAVFCLSPEHQTEQAPRCYIADIAVHKITVLSLARHDRRYRNSGARS